MSIVDLLRTKIEKLEGRLQVIISTQLDRVEKKVDRLVELAVAGRFHPATSAFDGTTSSIAYVPENKSNDGLEIEAMFDDVTDMSAAERKVDLPEEDLKLEEDVRGKNIGANELETKLGFDYMRDVPTAATNVETREEDPKLKEKGRGKNVGGKDLENEAGSGNDIDEQENEKMVKESVGKEIILEEKHLDVEKEIDDFVTPEKHDLATNESTQCDIAEIDEAGYDPSKGRGYHRKRKARLLCSPYMDSTKRRKLSDINVYNPYGEVDPVKVDAFCKWMEITSSW
ncbi:uncharacterized protein LOC111394078 [Olea europaea var. sylvestris]|uniref:uncharacterized protein LOC111394078 n=1 Tax=Olea europaea var. sylvestris TaxID=158386 RepID=UPI000C1D8C57|nr:uncharacterized protein LOC111394078 [Olea europaea var. sylvestris]